MSQEREGAGRGVDPYEASYMKGEGGVLYRDKIVAPKWFHALMALPLTIVLIAAISEWMKLGAVAGLLPLLFAVPIIALMWMFFSVLRITVSRELVQVQYGLIGPKIDVKDIISAQAVEYDWKRFGGWGIRLNARGEWAYNMMGDAGQAVRIVYRSGSREYTIFVSTHHPALLADAINQAMRGEVVAGDEVIFDSMAAQDEVSLDVSVDVKQEKR